MNRISSKRNDDGTGTDARELILIVALKLEKPRSNADAANLVLSVLSCIGSIRPSRWAALGFAGRQVECATLTEIEGVLENGTAHPDRRSPLMPATRAVIASKDGKSIGDVVVTIETAWGDAPTALKFGSRILVAFESAYPKSGAIFDALVRGVEPRMARMGGARPPPASTESFDAPLSGVVTYASNSMYAEPLIREPLTVRPFESKGWRLTAPDDSESLAAARAALRTAYKERQAYGAASNKTVAAGGLEQQATEELPYFGYGPSDPHLPFEVREGPSTEFRAQMDAWQAEWAAVPSSDGETAPLPGPRPRYDPTLALDTKLLTVEEYAAVCAEIELHPDRALQAYNRQGVRSVEEGERVHKLFAIRFQVDKDLHARWKELTRRYGEWLRTQQEPR